MGATTSERVLMRMPWRPHRDGQAGWPVVLRDASAEPAIVLRPLRASDEAEWQQVRRDNVAHVQPWEPTLPPGSESRSGRSTMAGSADASRSTTGQPA